MARQPRACEPPARVGPQRQRTLLALAACGEPCEHAARPGEQGRRSSDSDLPRVELIESPVTEQRALPVAIELHDVAAPLVIERIERELRALEPAAVLAREQRHRLARGHRAEQAALDARWRNGRRRIEAMPCTVDDRLGPG